MEKIISKVTGRSSLPTAQLGRNGPKITKLGYGFMGLSTFYGPAKPDEQRLALIDKLYEEGELFWDTADMYGDSEDLLGKWFKANPDKRDKIFLATKFANRVMEDGSRKVDSTPEWARQACEKSLRRLGLPNVDLYYIHRVDGKTPIEKTMEVLVQMKNEGKFKYIGISECSEDTLRRAHAVHPITAVQLEYSPFSLEIESPQYNLLKTCRELGIATVAYSPIGRGMLGGQIRSPDDFEEGDFRKMAPRFNKENFPKNLELVDKITAIAKKKGVTSSQLTLAWLMNQGDDIFPIPGTTQPHRLDENLGALKVKLTKEEDAEIRKASQDSEIVGSRYPEAFSKALFADTPPLNA